MMILGDFSRFLLYFAKFDVNCGSEFCVCVCVFFFVATETFCDSCAGFRTHSASAIDWHGFCSAPLCVLVLKGTTSEGARRRSGIVASDDFECFLEDFAVFAPI